MKDRGEALKTRLAKAFRMADSWKRSKLYNSSVACLTHARSLIITEQYDSAEAMIAVVERWDKKVRKENA